jgi:hypothetical protein
MLRRVDRVQAVVADRRATAAAYRRLLDAEVAREDRVRLLGARRAVLRLGCSEVELLEPDGSGVAAEFFSRTKGGLFAAGFATADIAQLRAHLHERRVPVAEERGQLFLSPAQLGLPGLQTVVSTDREPSRAGLVRHLYEVTLLVQDFSSVVQQAAATFALDPTHFVPIRSFAKRGPAFYMCYCEADDLRPIRERLHEHAPNGWTGPDDSAPPDNIFIHPAVLGGMMLGVSRTTFAWTWSGHPERVAPSTNS